jgi:hypothetical protein
LSYRRRSSKRYDARKAARLWIRTAKSLREGKGIPPKTPYYPNPYGEPLVKPEALKELSLDPATAMVTAGFYLFGPHWPRIYEKIEVRDKRGRRRKLPNNLWKGYEVLFEAECLDA